MSEKWREEAERAWANIGHCFVNPQAMRSDYIDERISFANRVEAATIEACIEVAEGVMPDEVESDFDEGLESASADIAAKLREMKP
jgi:hypothetical protein